MDNSFYFNKLKNIKEQVINNDSVILTKFLDLKEQTDLINVFSKDKNIIIFDGGFVGAIRKRCLMSKFNGDNLKIKIFQIMYNKKYLVLTHSNVLGTLMSLGIERDVLGDIVIDNDNLSYIVVTETVSPFIIKEFTSINNVLVTLKEVDSYNIIVKEKISKQIIYLNSLRLDALISKITNNNREESKKLIIKELVKVNDCIITKISSSFKIGDFISVRKYGKFLINESNGFSKKDKYILEIHKYIN